MESIHPHHKGIVMNKTNLKDISNALRQRAALVDNSYALTTALKTEASARAEFDQQVCVVLAQSRKGLNDPDHQMAAKRLTDIKAAWKTSLLNLKSELEDLENV